MKIGREIFEFICQQNEMRRPLVICDKEEIETHTSLTLKMMNILKGSFLCGIFFRLDDEFESFEGEL